MSYRRRCNSRTRSSFHSDSVIVLLTSCCYPISSCSPHLFLYLLRTMFLVLRRNGQHNNLCRIVAYGTFPTMLLLVLRVLELGFARFPFASVAGLCQNLLSGSGANPLLDLERRKSRASDRPLANAKTRRFFAGGC